MNPRIATIAIVTSLSAIAALAIAAPHHSASLARIDLGVLQLMIGLGLLTIVLALLPARNGGIRFDRAGDLSRMSLDIRVSRPMLMRVGMLALGIGLIGLGLVQVLGKIF